MVINKRMNISDKMKFKAGLLILITAFVFPGCVHEKVNKATVKIIFDTDFGPDYDDVGALAEGGGEGR